MIISVSLLTFWVSFAFLMPKIRHMVGTEWGERKRASKVKTMKALYYWCPERESNSHRVKLRGILSPLRLPVPPSGQRFTSYTAVTGLSIVNEKVRS